MQIIDIDFYGINGGKTSGTIILSILFFCIN